MSGRARVLERTKIYISCAMQGFQNDRNCLVFQFLLLSCSAPDLLAGVPNLSLREWLALSKDYSGMLDTEQLNKGFGGFPPDQGPRFKII